MNTIHGADSKDEEILKNEPSLRHLSAGQRRNSELVFQSFQPEHFDTRAEQVRQMIESPEALKSLPFSKAAQHWIEYKSFISPQGRARFVSPRSLSDLRQYIHSLNIAFRDKQLDAIHAGHIRQYQLDRAAGALTGNQVGPNKINQEVGTLIRIMKFAHCWTPGMEQIYMPLQREESDIPRALSPGEQQRWLDVSTSHPGWRFVYWYSLLGFDCPMSTNEQRALRLGDIDLNNNMVMVRVASSKNKYRTRSIPLSDQARWAIERLLERANAAGSTMPQHYLMPFREKHVWHPERSMTVSGIKRSWNAVRLASGLGWFRPYDLRHTSITRYAEAGTPIAVIMALAGHISRRMLEHYTHISEQAKRKAVQNTVAKHAAQGWKVVNA